MTSRTLAEFWYESWSRGTDSPIWSDLSEDERIRWERIGDSALLKIFRPAQREHEWTHPMSLEPVRCIKCGILVESTFANEACDFD